MSEGCGSVLIAAISGRALAHAASKAGYAPLVADFFADADTQSLSENTVKMTSPIACGFQWEVLEPALDALAAGAPSPLLGLVYGSGFEDRPALLEKIAARWRMLGNDAATIAQVSDPEVFFATLDRCKIAYPKTQMCPPVNLAGWLVKRAGGAGGSHIQATQRAGNHAAEGDVYYQTLVRGRSISAVFAANGQHARVLGFSEQWTAPAPDKPWRYGGALQPAILSSRAAEKMADIVRVLSDAFALCGLNTADFILDGDTPLLLEINPRPGATLDIFDNASTPFFAAHIDAVLHGSLPAHAPVFDDVSASAIVFAPENLVIPSGIDWPKEAADLPKPGERIDKEQPICTLHSRADSAEAAKRSLRLQHDNLLTMLETAEPISPEEEEDHRTLRRKQ
ncbi:MAG: ATP-grasp domain-containing protein [Pseudomonadota bacterium]